MNFNAYQKQAMETKLVTNPNYFFLGLANEAGEACGKLKKIIRDQGGVLTPEACQDIASELGDVLWYVAGCADALGIKLDTIAKNNIAKLADRKARGVLQGSGDNR